MDQQNEIHVELICGGRPGFEVADSIRSVVRLIPGASSHIVHVDREEEAGQYGSGEEDEFLAFRWNSLAHSGLRKDQNLINIVGQDRIEDVLQRWPPGKVPYNHPFAVRLATWVLRTEIRAIVRKHVNEALESRKSFFQAVCCVPEGPTGIGVTWALLDMIPIWDQEVRRQYQARGHPFALNFDTFLIEIVPAFPGIDGDQQNVLQGHVSRLRLHKKMENWPYYWFRFDGARLVTGEESLMPHDLRNPEASSVGAAAVGAILTSRFVPPTASRP